MVKASQRMHNRRKGKKGDRVDEPHIHAHMPIAEIVTFCPDAEPLLREYGLHCFHCEANAVETLAQGCMSHGYTEDDVGDLVADLNRLLRERPARPLSLTITRDAARAIRSVADQEKRKGEGLVVIADNRGGFCMEFRTEPESGERTFSHAEEPDVRIFASTLTLHRIGGSTIDFREGRFKLDLPDAPEMCACGGKCSCEK